VFCYGSLVKQLAGLAAKRVLFSFFSVYLPNKCSRWSAASAIVSESQVATMSSFLSPMLLWENDIVTRLSSNLQSYILNFALVIFTELLFLSCMVLMYSFSLFVLLVIVMG
jgi:hypothetical protein